METTKKTKSSSKRERQRIRPLAEMIKEKNISNLSPKEEEILCNKLDSCFPYYRYFKNKFGLLYGRLHRFSFYNFFIISNLINNGYTPEKEKAYKLLLEDYDNVISNILSEEEYYSKINDYINPRYYSDDIYSLMLGKNSFIYYLADSDGFPAFFFNCFEPMPSTNFGLDFEEDRMISELLLNDSDYRDIITPPDYLIEEEFRFNCTISAATFFGSDFTDDNSPKKCLFSLDYNGDNFSWMWKLNPLNILKVPTYPNLIERKLNLKVMKLSMNEIEKYDLDEIFKSMKKLEKEQKTELKKQKYNPVLDYKYNRELAFLSFKYYLKRYYNTLKLLNETYENYLENEETNIKENLKKSADNFSIDFDKGKELLKSK